jgi:hypothetical protein
VCQECAIEEVAVEFMETVSKNESVGAFCNVVMLSVGQLMARKGQRVISCRAHTSLIDGAYLGPVGSWRAGRGEEARFLRGNDNWE